jgi:hypothetical protein
MGRVEPGDDMHGTQRTLIQTGTRVTVPFFDEFFRDREAQNWGPLHLCDYAA